MKAKIIENQNTKRKSENSYTNLKIKKSEVF